MAADDDLGPIGGVKIGSGRSEEPRRPIVAQMRPGPHHQRKPPNIFSRLILAAIVLAAIAFFVAPWFALWAVRSAAESRDGQALEELVDFSAVREGLEGQMPGAPPSAPPIDPWKHPLEAMQQAFQTKVVAAPRPSVLPYLTPDAIADMTNGLPLRQPVTAHPFPALRYWGFDRCRLAVKDPTNPSRVTLLTFERKGIYTWKLSRIALPQ